MNVTFGANVSVLDYCDMVVQDANLRGSGMRTTRELYYFCKFSLNLKLVQN